MTELNYWLVARQIAADVLANQVDATDRPVIEHLDAIVSLIRTDTFFQWLVQASVTYRSQNRDYVAQNFAQDGISLSTEAAPDVDLYTQPGPVDLIGAIVADKIQTRLQHLLTAAVYLQDIFPNNSKYRSDDLRGQGIPAEVLTICQLLHPAENKGRRHYLIKVREHDLATIIKLADLYQHLTKTAALPSTAATIAQCQEDQWAINILKSKYTLQISPLVPNKGQLTADR